MIPQRRTTAAPALAAAVILLALAAPPGEAHAQQVPDWVRQVFAFYVDGQITEGELLNALKFLIGNGIIHVEAPAGAAERSTEDRGDFRVEYGPNPNSRSAAADSAAAWLRDTRLLEDNADWLSDTYRLPHDVKILGVECGTANAFYSKSKKEIRMCYELVDKVRDVGREMHGEDPGIADDFAYNVLDGVMLHEAGHALIDVHGLPATGHEEDAVDQFSAMIQSRTYGDYDPRYEAGRIMMLDMAEWWDHMAGETERPRYWSVHSLSMQRFYNIACYAYGADPAYNEDLVGMDYLPADRAEACPDEYEKMASSWNRLLDGYLVE